MSRPPRASELPTEVWISPQAPTRGMARPNPNARPQVQAAMIVCRGASRTRWAQAAATPGTPTGL